MYRIDSYPFLRELRAEQGRKLCLLYYQWRHVPLNTRKCENHSTFHSTKVSTLHHWSTVPDYCRVYWELLWTWRISLLSRRTLLKNYSSILLFHVFRFWGSHLHQNTTRGTNSYSSGNRAWYAVPFVCWACNYLSRAAPLGAFVNAFSLHMMYRASNCKFDVLGWEDDVFSPIIQRKSLFSTEEFMLSKYDVDPVSSNRRQDKDTAMQYVTYYFFEIFSVHLTPASCTP